MSDNIPPYEIQMEIIKKVHDVTPLLRFRAVSKQWKVFIDSSEFITSYGARDTQPHRLLLRYKEATYRHLDIKYICFVDDDDDASFPKQQQDFSPNVPSLIKQIYMSKVIGSSCGLWCFHDYYSTDKEMLVMWNPSIRKSVGIVVPRVLSKTKRKTTFFGFGVCPSTYDPTIVGITKCYIEDKHKVGIFTLSSKTWKMLPSSNLPRKSIILISSTQVAIDRFIYWVAYDEIVGNDDVSDYKTLILSFDLRSQEFKEIQLPHRVENQSVLNFSISKLRESLVVSTYIDGVDALVYEIWMMGVEDGVMTSFTKLFTINTPDTSVETLLGFRKSDEPIMETRQRNSFFPTIEVYEQLFERTNDLGIVGRSGLFFICPYTEALLLVDHSDGTIFSNDC